MSQFNALDAVVMCVHASFTCNANQQFIPPARCNTCLAGKLTARHRHSDDIREAPKRTLPPLVSQRSITCGTVGHGMDLIRLVWTRERQVLSMQDQDLQEVLPNRPRRVESKAWDQQRNAVLQKTPIWMFFSSPQRVSPAGRDPSSQS